MEITTGTGFVCQVDPDAMDDMELLEDLAALDKGDATALPSAVARLLGAGGREALYDHVRTPTGRVPITKAMEEVGAVLAALKDSNAKK